MSAFVRGGTRMRSVNTTISSHTCKCRKSSETSKWQGLYRFACKGRNGNRYNSSEREEKKKRAFKTVQQQREDNENKSAQRSQADDRKKSPPFVLETSSADDHRNESRRGKTTKAHKSAESLGFILFFSLFSACVDCHPFTIFQRKEHSTKQRFDKRPNTTRLKYSVEKTT